MRLPATNLVRAALLQLALITLLAAPGLADRTLSAVDASRLLRHDALSVTSRSVTRMAVHAPGQYANEVLAVFKMRIDRFLETPLDALNLDDQRLRPYLLGGRTVLRVPMGRTVGENVPGAEHAFAMHIGGGAELRLRDGVFLTVDFGEILHGGALSDRSYETYKLGFAMDF